MQEGRTVAAARPMTTPPKRGGIEITKLYPLWAVEVQAIGTAYSHTWRGLAANTQEARDRATADARRCWPGFGLCVRSVVQVA